MFTKYMRGLSRQDFPVVLSITNTTLNTKADTIIQRNHLRMDDGEKDIYNRAREIFYRARQQRPMRAASIF